MKYTKHAVGPYNIHIIQTDKFKTVTMEVLFKRKIVREEVTMRNLLNMILTESSSKYPTQRYLIMATEDLYNLRFSMGVNFLGSYSVMTFMTQFLNEKYTEEGMLEKSILFLFDLILNPDFENGKFKEDKLQIVKNKLIEEIKEKEKNPYYYANYKMRVIMDKDALYSLDVHGSIEDLNQINVDNLTEYYKQVIHSDIVDIFIVGDIDVDKVKNLIKENFSINTIKKQPESHYVEHKKIRKRAKKATEPYDVKQSQLVIGCKIEPLTNFECNYVSYVYNFILGGGPDARLFTTVREKHSLCYSISSRLKLLHNLLIINAGIDKKNVDKTTKLIRREMNKILKGLFTDEEIEKAKIYYKNALKETMDYPKGIIKHYMEKEYYNLDLYQERIKQIDKVTKQMVMDFAKKVHVDTIFALEGDETDNE